MKGAHIKTGSCLLPSRIGTKDMLEGGEWAADEEPP